MLWITSYISHYNILCICGSNSNWLPDYLLNNTLNQPSYFLLVLLYISFIFPAPLDSNCPPPSLKELCDAVSVHTDEWRSIAVCFELSYTDIERISIECNNIIEDCFRRVFSKWERQRTVPYTWDTIVKALESPSMGEIRLAAEIRKKYNLL